MRLEVDRPDIAAARRFFSNASSAPAPPSGAPVPAAPGGCTGADVVVVTGALPASAEVCVHPLRLLGPLLLARALDAGQQ